MSSEHFDGNLGLRLVVNTEADRVSRGGSWIRPAGYARAAGRGWGSPGYRSSNLGFRLTVNNSPENTMTTKEMA